MLDLAFCLDFTVRPTALRDKDITEVLIELLI